MKIKIQLKALLIISFTLIVSMIAHATDQELSAKLKNELEYETKRRNDFSNQRLSKKTFEREREKGLALFLEEQEKWDVTRDKGLKEQRANRLKTREMDESSPEYMQDQKAKKKYQAELEINRQKQIATKQQVFELFKNKVKVSEEEELSVYNDRPRFALRTRGSNKWSAKAKAGSGSGFSSGSSSGSNSPGATFDSNNGSSAPFDYPPVPNQDYIPSDNFEDLPPPPPMMPYEGYGAPGSAQPPNFEGGDYPPPVGYPPPPPEGGWDF